MKLHLALFTSIPLLGALPASLAQTYEQKVVGSDVREGDLFGFAVSVSGHSAIVGAPSHDGPPQFGGAAYVYAFTPDGWVERDKLMASDAGPGAQFGIATALDGGRALIGAWHDSGDAPGSWTGAAYVFESTGTGWTETAKLVALDAAAEDELGRAVALDGNVAVAGATGSATAGPTAGAAYVFERSGTEWFQTAKLIASDATPIDYFGRSVAVEGDTVVVGAFVANGAQLGTGAAYVFERTARGWFETAKLTAAGGVTGETFGESVAISGGTILVGALKYDGVDLESGAVYAFDRIAGEWVEAELLEASDARALHWFGERVALDGQRAVVGARLDDDGGADAGAIYTFERGASGWQETSKLNAADGAPNDQLGLGLDISGGVALAGARFDDDEGAASGSAYFFGADGSLSAYCDCERGAPCGNNYPGGGCAGSIGLGATIEATGFTNVSFDNLVLFVTGVPPHHFGLFYMGPDATEIPFGDGLRCVAGGGTGVFRFPVRSSGPSGALAEGPGLVAFSHANFQAGGAITAGQTWRFQGWYRDPAGPCGTGFNLSNAIAVEFAP